MKLKRRKKEFSIPLFSMSDVAFLLLIFIMLVALINYRKEVRIRYPQVENAKKTSAVNNLEIWVDMEGNLYADGLPCGIESIEAAIIEAYNKSSETRVHIIADRGVQYKHIQKVLEILQILQYRTVSFVVKDP